MVWRDSRSEYSNPAPCSLAHHTDSDCVKLLALSFSRIEAYIQLREGDDDVVPAKLVKDGRVELVQEHQAAILEKAENSEFEKHRAICKLREELFRGGTFSELNDRELMVCTFKLLPERFCVKWSYPPFDLVS